MSPLPQDEPSDDFKAGWDAALAVAAELITPKPLKDDPDSLDRLAHKVGTINVSGVVSLKGMYQFRHTKAAQQ
jgi:hypothetical protein